MAVLHKEFCSFYKEIKLDKEKNDGLAKSRRALRKRIKQWFDENKNQELQPKFHGQGSFEMNTSINPIPVYDKGNNKLLKYDLDDGIYFLEKDGENNKRAINTWHDWVYDASDDHTNEDTIRKTTCVRVVFSDGHHIDLPIYYKDGDTPELAHKSKDWIESDPKEFYEWFNDAAKTESQIRKIVRYFKAWKNYRETENSNLKLPSGFELTILTKNNIVIDDNDDKAFLETTRAIKKSLDEKFECLRPTTPKDEDVFESYSTTRKDGFMNNLSSLVLSCEKAEDESNFKNASEHLRKQFGDRFPLGKDENKSESSSVISSVLDSFSVKPKPYGPARY